jgi:hypothetical protein
MSEVWLTVGVPAVVAIATGIYTTGGRAALARRAIRQELEIAALLPEGQGRAGVERMAEEKAVLYASRWIGPQPLRRHDHARLLGAVVGGGLMTWSGSALYDRVDGHAWLGVYLLAWMVSGIALTALGLTLWVSLSVMADNAAARASTIEVRRQRVERHLSASEES